MHGRPSYSALFAAAAFFASVACGAAAAEVEADFIIYGATSAGLSAAIAAQREGLKVVVVSPEREIGGLTTGGLGQTDIGNKDVFGGLSRRFYRDVKRHYADDSSWKWQKHDEYKPTGQSAFRREEDAMWTFEPSAARAVLDSWVKTHAIDIRRGEFLDRGEGGVEKSDCAVVKSFRTLSGTVYRARMFADATYEGDLMAAAGCTYAVGREANAEFGETLNGRQKRNSRNHQLMPGVDPYVEKGNPASGLLPGIEPDDGEADGTADGRVQAYCFRMCLTDVPENRIPFKRPADYSPLDYELLLRNLEATPAKKLAVPWINSAMPNRKTDTNNKFGFSTDLIGGSARYPEASYEERGRIAARHLSYQQGLMWTLANDERVPASIREEVSRWGTCRDEFQGERGDGWQNQLYVREARRLRGEYVMTEANCRGAAVAGKPVAMGAYTMDSHNCRRYVGEDGFAHNEGNIEVGRDARGRKLPPYPIDYGAIVPRRAECANLFVPVCLSATHIAFGSIRMEPVFFTLGEVAGVAAALAIRHGTPVQDVPYAELKEKLVAAGVVLERPANGAKPSQNGAKSRIAGRPEPVAAVRETKPRLHYGFKGEVSSGYLSSGGTLGDTRPVSTQQVTWLADFGEAGSISGYVWTKSSLHNKQHEIHRAEFDQIETTIYYGNTWRFPDGVELRAKVGPLWNPLIGYNDGHNCDWGIHFVQSLENSILTPYVNALWMIAPSPRSRIRFGVQRDFPVNERWSIMPFLETVWMDERRFQSRYGGMPQDRFLGGAFATMTAGLQLSWYFKEGWRMFMRFRQYDIINSQSRRAVRRQSSYYAKCDYPIVGIGIECSF
ncbi:MAG: FAD-dependent oxidoreductase [Kiritimatiellae bacterium]|nr:FAD-dependent oxidoreductase [Kiritimatiellia bacterium]